MGRFRILHYSGNTWLKIYLGTNTPRLSGSEGYIRFYDTESSIYNNIYVKNVYNSSDLRLKTNVASLGSSTAKVLALRPVTYSVAAHVIGQQLIQVQWHYGMTIIGDPMINFLYKYNDRRPFQITLNGFKGTGVSPFLDVIAKDRITANNYVIPTGKIISFKAPTIIINGGFECALGTTFTIKH